jgi:hypothetical protein
MIFLSVRPGRSSWERWRLAGEFQFTVPDWLTGRQPALWSFGATGRRFREAYG